MMEKLLTPEDVAAILKVKPRTAYTYMAQMAHMEKPLRVTEGSLRAWIDGRTLGPGEKPGKGTPEKRRRTSKMPMEADWRIPRR